MPRDPDVLFAARKQRQVPFDFVLDELAVLDPWTRPMFGCVAVYVEERILFILRAGKNDSDNGVWIATTKEHHDSLRREFPNLRSIAVLGTGVTGWQILPDDADDFEESVLRACVLARAGEEEEAGSAARRGPEAGTRSAPALELLGRAIRRLGGRAPGVPSSPHRAPRFQASAARSLRRAVSAPIRPPRSRSRSSAAALSAAGRD
jgi:hypothetical protein